MFSSLPSASKLYASGNSKSKSKSNASNTKRKRRRSKTVIETSVHDDLTETETLVGTFKPSLPNAFPENDSDSYELDSDCTPKIKEDEVTLIDKKNEYLIAVSEENDFSTDVPSEQENLILTLNQEGNKNENMIVISAEVHCDSLDDQLTDDEFDISVNAPKPFHQPPIIIISSADSPDRSTDCKDQPTAEVLQSSVVEDKELPPDHYCIPSKFSPYETIEEDDEFDEVLTVVTEQDKNLEEADEIEQGPKDNYSGIKENEEASNERQSNDQLLPPEKEIKNQSVDDLSISSDCCTSKNIYNDYFTDAIDETDDNFMIDDPKTTSSSDEFTQTDSEDMENPPAVSPKNSEVSGTESSLGGGGKKPIQDGYFDDKICQTSVLCKPAQTSNSRRLRRAKALAATEKECTKSLPDFLEYNTRSSSPDLIYDAEPLSTCTSDVSVRPAFRDSTVQTSFRKRSIFEEVPDNSNSLNCNLPSEICKQSQCLPPVTIQEARLRSYVVGSVKASGSLLGVEELTRYFPDKKVNVFVGTWNMNGQDPPQCVDDFLLPLGVSNLPDVYAIGVQEGCQSRSEWDILMQTTIGPSHVLLMSTSLGVLHLAIFIRRDLIWFCSEPEDSNVTTRPGSMVKTKGAVAISFMLFGTSFLFINCHLTAHERKYKERVSDYEKICNLLDLPKKIPLKPQYQNKDVTSRFDNVFWCGDLNFRVVQDRPSVLSFVEEKLQQTILTCDFLLRHDQLHKAMNEGVAFHGFHEGIINFVPSYKFDVGTRFFNSTKQRVPSYTDRVLFRCKREDSISCLHYNVVSDILTSDHKPVFAVFDVDIRPGRDNIPLAAGQFKREVYLEANRRRATALEVKTNHKSSTICSVM